jgi:Tfp pilus assembly protein PilZ
VDYTAGGVRAFGFTGEISAGGFYLRQPRNLSVGDEVLCALHLPDGAAVLQVSAVVRHISASGAGLELAEDAEVAANRIRVYIENRLAAKLGERVVADDASAGEIAQYTAFLCEVGRHEDAFVVYRKILSRRTAELEIYEDAAALMSERALTLGDAAGPLLEEIELLVTAGLQLGTSETLNAVRRELAELVRARERRGTTEEERLRSELAAERQKMNEMLRELEGMRQKMRELEVKVLAGPPAEPRVDRSRPRPSAAAPSIEPETSTERTVVARPPSQVVPRIDDGSGFVDVKTSPMSTVQVQKAIAQRPLGSPPELDHTAPTELDPTAPTELDPTAPPELEPDTQEEKTRPSWQDSTKPIIAPAGLRPPGGWRWFVVVASVSAAAAGAALWAWTYSLEPTMIELNVTDDDPAVDATPVPPAAPAAVAPAPLDEAPAVTPRLPKHRAARRSKN